jgi:hypothetical protein
MNMANKEQVCLLNQKRASLLCRLKVTSQASITGRAARYVQSLNSTEIHYKDIIAALTNRFVCPRQTCWRHFSAMRNYPRLTKGTPETLANLIGTMKLHLRALKNLGDPITSNTVIIGLFLSKLNPDTIQQWEDTIPNRRVPSYSHLVDFLQRKANCVLTTSDATPARRTPEQRKPLRQGCPRRNAFTTTHVSLTCPICQWSHRIWTCSIFKEKPVKKRRKWKWDREARTNSQEDSDISDSHYRSRPGVLWTSYLITKIFGTLPSSGIIPPGPPNDKLAMKDEAAHSLHCDSMVTRPRSKLSLMLANSERNCSTETRVHVGQSVLCGTSGRCCT